MHASYLPLTYLSTKLPGLVVSIRNDGKGIPIELHKTEKLYIPELIFGHLLTGSNFNDASTRLTGGSHGFGAKLTNIFSDEFSVETYDAKKGLLYQQTWRNNMSECSDATITTPISTPISTLTPSVTTISTPTTVPTTVSTTSYTKITFTPDMSKFGAVATTEAGKRVTICA